MASFSDGKTARCPASILYAALLPADEALTEPDEVYLAAPLCLTKGWYEDR